MNITDLWLTCINCLMHTNNDTIIAYTVQISALSFNYKNASKCIEQICNEMGYTQCETVNGPINKIIIK